MGEEGQFRLFPPFQSPLFISFLVEHEQCRQGGKASTFSDGREGLVRSFRGKYLKPSGGHHRFSGDARDITGRSCTEACVMTVHTCSLIPPEHRNPPQTTLDDLSEYDTFASSANGEFQEFADMKRGICDKSRNEDSGNLRRNRIDQRNGCVRSTLARQ